jgi:predicted molibdopterin-dependent oxidoreductase YjgC
MSELGRRLEAAAAPIVLWDEADLAGEPDAAAALARLVASHPGARQLELGADVNGAGLRALGIPTEGVLEAALESRVDALLCVHADPLTAPGSERWARALERVSTVVAIAALDSPITRRAAVALPALSRHEDEGVLVSMAGRAQRLRPGARPPDGAGGGWEILIALSHALGAPLPQRSARAAFESAAAASEALAGLSYASLGVFGQPIGPPPPAAAGGAGARVDPEGEGLVLVATTEIFGDGAAARASALAARRTGPSLALNPAEAERLGVAGAARVSVASPEGRVVLPLRLDPALPAGGAFVALGPAGDGAHALLAPDRRALRVTVAAAP